MGVPADPTCSGRGAGYPLLRWRRVHVSRASHDSVVRSTGRSGVRGVRVGLGCVKSPGGGQGEQGRRTGRGGGGREVTTFSSTPFGNARTRVCRAVSPQDDARGRTQNSKKRVASRKSTTRAQTNKVEKKEGKSATQRRLAAARRVAGAEPRAASPRQREGRTWSCGPPGRGDAGAQQAVGLTQRTPHTLAQAEARTSCSRPPCARGPNKTKRLTRKRRKGRSDRRRVVVARGFGAHAWRLANGK